MGAVWLITGTNAILLTLSNPVRVTADGGGGADFASPYNAQPWDQVIADTSRGSVVINIPTLVGRGTRTMIKHDDDTSLLNYSVTINGPTSPAVQLAQPTPNNGTFGASVTLPPTSLAPGNTIREQYKGTEYTWENIGSAGGYCLV